jgi:5-formyltetrahydrofolate cyclo-ligase
MDKKILRKHYIEKRNNLSNLEVERISHDIAMNLFQLDIYKNSSFIMTYVDFNKEVRTEEIIRHSIDIGKRIGIPITIKEERKLIISELKDFDEELEISTYNILAPKNEFIRIVHPSIIDLVLVPGAIFDRNGYRIGYGGGYYDRFLPSLNKKTTTIGLAYDLQLIDNVPRGCYDLPVDFILTEKEFINCKTKNSEKFY